jgi:hypothetical protein
MDAPARREAPALPHDQVDALIDAETEALDLAHQGRTAEGYALLLAGCRRAQEAATDQPWDGALLERWQGALERYGERWPGGRA